MKKILLSIWETAKIFILALVIVVPIRILVFQPFFVKGDSMEPNFANGDYLIVDELSYHFRDPKRGEVVVFKYPANPSQRYIKRIVGLPEETIEVQPGKVFVYASAKDNPQIPVQLDESEYLPDYISALDQGKLQLLENEYYVLGDNRPFSSDSRRWGSLPKENIIGRVLFRLWPIPALAKVPTPEY